MNLNDIKDERFAGVEDEGNTLDCQLSNRYSELVTRARSLLRKERPDHTLQTCALVHEAYLRMINLYKVDWKDQEQFLPISVGVMRRVLVDHVRSSKAQKRGGELVRVEFREDVASTNMHVDVEALDCALERLAEHDPVQASIVEHRYFGGLTIQQTGTVLGLSPATIKRKWKVAQAWLYRELQAV